MKLTLKFCWVRGLAARRQKEGTVLAWDETLNEAADSLATSAQHIPSDHSCFCRSPWPEQQVSIASVDGEINGRLDLELRYHCTASDVLSYWCKRFGWSEQIMSTVEIEGTARALKRLPITAAARICKLRCGWLPVNEQEARHDKDKRNG